MAMTDATTADASVDRSGEKQKSSRTLLLTVVALASAAAVALFVRNANEHSTAERNPTQTGDTWRGSDNGYYGEHGRRHHGWYRRHHHGQGPSRRLTATVTVNGEQQVVTLRP